MPDSFRSADFSSPRSPERKSTQSRVTDTEDRSRAIGTSPFARSLCLRFRFQYPYHWSRPWQVTLGVSFGPINYDSNEKKTAEQGIYVCLDFHAILFYNRCLYFDNHPWPGGIPGLCPSILHGQVLRRPMVHANGAGHQGSGAKIFMT